MVEVGKVEDLQIHPLGTGLGVPAQDVDRLGRGPGDTVGAQLGHLPADGLRAPGDLRLVLADASQPSPMPPTGADSGCARRPDRAG